MVMQLHSTVTTATCDVLHTAGDHSILHFDRQSGVVFDQDSMRLKQRSMWLFQHFTVIAYREKWLGPLLQHNMSV